MRKRGSTWCAITVSTGVATAPHSKSLISWCKMYGKGRVFYTSLGHREDVWDPETPAKFKRENSKEVSERYQKFILGGIKWALGLAAGDAKPQAAK